MYVNPPVFTSFDIIMSVLNPTVHFWLHHTAHCAEKIISAHLRTGSALAERVGQGEVGGVTHRVLCTWWLLGLAVEGPWLGTGGPPFALTAWTGLEKLLSPCMVRLGSEQVCEQIPSCHNSAYSNH